MIRIPRCYDSHSHFLASAVFAGALSLERARNSADLSRLVENATKSDFLFGFGWLPEREAKLFIQDEVQTPSWGHPKLLLSRSDGHGIWANSEVLKMLGLDSLDLKGLPTRYLNQVGRSETGHLNGLFYEEAAFWLWNQVMTQNLHLQERLLLQAQELWIQKGFSHVRDMSGTLAQWRALKNLETRGQLSMFIEQNFEHFRHRQVAETIQDALQCQSEQSAHLRVGGVKVFLDGTLGAKSAAISQCYLGCDHQGELLYSYQELMAIVTEVWDAKLPICVHIIGDRGAELIIQVACELWDKGYQGQLHLEHLELCHPDSLNKLQGRQAHIHFQPSHFLSDQPALDAGLPALMRQGLFLWARAQSLGVPFSWGFDSPISPIGLELTYEGLKRAEGYGVAPIRGSWWGPHSHPDPLWGEGVYTDLNPEFLPQVHFMDPDA